jgi:autotransporter family porin
MIERSRQGTSLGLAKTLVVVLVLGTLIMLVGAAAAMAEPSIIYVDKAAVGANSGSSWENAYTELQTALATAVGGDQIWVAKGTYYPAVYVGPTSRNVSFQLVKYLELYGGFSGGELSLGERDWETNPTILSGNIGSLATNTDNTKNVVRGADFAVLDGFTIEDGNSAPPSASGPPTAPVPPKHVTPEQILNRGTSGAGLSNHQAATIVRNTIIQNCRAGKGGGVYNMTATAPGVTTLAPVFINVTIRNNYAAGRGAGMMNDLGTNPVIINCTFEGNHCDTKGGGLYNDFGCSPLVMNSVFHDNSAPLAPAMGNDGTSCPIIVGCTITGNTATGFGAGLAQGSYNANFPEWANMPTVITSVIGGNASLTGGPANVFTWGDSWVVPYKSQIEGWDFSTPASSKQPGSVAQAAKVANLAKAVSGLDAATIWDRYNADILAITPSGAPLELDPNRPTFGVDFPFITDITVPATVFYVDARSRAKGANGTSWSKAFPDLQQGIDAAHAAGGGEVWVAAGTYYPGKDRTSSFLMREDIAIYGGFLGNEASLSQRDWGNNQTVLSGNIGNTKKSSDNVYHVVKGSLNSILDGFVVRDGRADGAIRDGYGGGMFNWSHDASAIVRNTTFTSNYARDGGAIFNFQDCYAYFKNVTITGNSAEMGGAMSCRFGASIQMDDSLIKDNFAEYRAGGVVVNYGSNAQFSNVQFVGNETNGCGGAVWTDDQASQYGGTLPLFSGCTFTGNKAAYDGGAVANYDGGWTKLDGCTFSGNAAPQGANLSNTLGASLFVETNNGGLVPGSVYTDGTSWTGPTP